MKPSTNAFYRRIRTFQAIFAVAYHMLADGLPYDELGRDYFDRLRPNRLCRYHIRRLEALGFEVMQPAA